jgi:glyoxylase-like metal-dependent hydrolase (beta-lactamase superfamily II)
MEIKAFTFNHFAENTYVLYDETAEAIVIDPGCYYHDEQEQLKAFIDEKHLQLKKVIFTHCHLDHVFGAQFLGKQFKNISFEAHREEVILIEHANMFSSTYGITMEQPPSLTRFIEEGESVTFGKTVLKAIFVPGHSPGSLCYYHESQGELFSGDVLFQGSIGRSDLPGGNQHLLLHGIKTKLLPLPETVVIYPGHGEYSTIGNEKALNPFLQ